MGFRLCTRQLPPTLLAGEEGEILEERKGLRRRGGEKGAAAYGRKVVDLRLCGGQGGVPRQLAGQRTAGAGRNDECAAG
jgi:hypothetical protein